MGIIQDDTIHPRRKQRGIVAWPRKQKNKTNYRAFHFIAETTARTAAAR